jgi:hypothetical protein
MLFATVLSLFIVPSLYIIVKSIEALFLKKSDKSGGTGGSNSDRPHEPNEKVEEYKLTN